MLYCLENNDKKKSIHVQYKCNFFPKYFQFVLGSTHGCGTRMGNSHYLFISFSTSHLKPLILGFKAFLESELSEWNWSQASWSNCAVLSDSFKFCSQMALSHAYYGKFTSTFFFVKTELQRAAHWSASRFSLLTCKMGLRTSFTCKHKLMLFGCSGWLAQASKTH